MLPLHVGVIRLAEFQCYCTLKSETCPLATVASLLTTNNALLLLHFRFVLILGYSVKQTFFCSKSIVFLF